MDIIPLEISKESDQSQSKHDALRCHPGNPFSWLRPAPPPAAGCFHLSSRGRLCCRRCVNITLFFFFSTRGGVLPLTHPSSSPPTSALEPLLLRSDVSLTWGFIFGQRLVSLKFSVTSHASVKQKQLFILSTFGPLFDLP